MGTRHWPEDVEDEIQRLQNKSEHYKSEWVKCSSFANKRIAELEQQLAASQAREKVLRDAIEFFIDTAICQADINVATEALAQPTDDTALKAALAAERERCAKVCEDNLSGLLIADNRYNQWVNSCAEAIRALGD